MKLENEKLISRTQSSIGFENENLDLKRELNDSKSQNEILKKENEMLASNTQPSNEFEKRKY